MKTILTLAVALAFVGSPVLAQEDDDDAPPAKREKREKQEKAPEVPAKADVKGRNDSLKAAFREVAEKTSSCVVKVGKDAYGVVLDGNLIATTAAAAHGHATVTVRGSAVSGEARVIGIDDRNAIALLAAPGEAKGIELAKSTDLRIGQFVVTVGSAKEALCAGVLSARNRRVKPLDLTQGNILMNLMSDGIDGPKRPYPKVLQHDAPMTDETLGTALVDSNGKLVGMNVGTGFRGSSYAIAADDLLECVKALKSGKTETPSEAPKTEAPKTEPPAKGKPFLGVNVKEAKDGKLFVEELAAGGPAEKAGLKIDDRVLTVDGKKLGSLDELADFIGTKKPGETIVLGISREGERRELKLTIGSK